MNLNSILRIAAGAFLVAAALGAGLLARSPWIIVPLGLIFTVAMMVGRSAGWARALNTHSPARIASEALATLTVQLALVSTFYLMGRGVAALIGREGSPFDSWDWMYVAVVAVVGIGLGAVVVRRESDAGQYPAFGANDATDAADDNDSAPAEIRMLPERITRETLFEGIHYTHGRTEAGVYDGTPNEKSAGSDEKIAAAEARLGFTLPEGLRELYRLQNGGAVKDICVPKPGIAEPSLYDHIIHPFAGYEDLYPLEMLRTVFDSTTDFADPDDPDQADQFPDGCRELLVLAQWYRVTLFLDYTQGTPPTVGFVDFDLEDWRSGVVRWDNFDAFMASLRRYESV
jgi:SMI1 / KNR4 family (SUKH-1)